MIELIERLINFKARYDVDGTFSIFTSEDKTDTFIIICLDKNGYRVAKCIEYKQWLEMSNMQKDHTLQRIDHRYPDTNDPHSE